MAANLDLRSGYTTETRSTYDVDELRQSETELYGKLVAIVSDRSNEFVVAAVYEQIGVQLLGVWVRCCLYNTRQCHSLIRRI